MRKHNFGDTFDNLGCTVIENNKIFQASEFSFQNSLEYAEEVSYENVDHMWAWERLLSTGSYGETFKDVVPKNIHMFNGSDFGVTRWHNDQKEGHVLTILYYFDESSFDIGGELMIRRVKEPNKIYLVFPQPHWLIILNQSTEFEHKVGFPKLDRRVLSFDCQVKHD